jgi:peptide deformylase
MSGINAGLRGLDWSPRRRGRARRFGINDGVTIREIRVFGDPVLRTPAEPVHDFHERLRVLVRDLLDTLDAPGRLGLAAPQIGVGLRVFAYNVDDARGYVVNPTIIRARGVQDDEEGCLSVPGLQYPTRRAQEILLTGYDAQGKPVTLEGTGLLARCFQHETDHLDGILYIDRLDRELRRQALRAIRESTWGSRAG